MRHALDLALTCKPHSDHSRFNSLFIFTLHTFLSLERCDEDPSMWARMDESSPQRSNFLNNAFFKLLCTLIFNMNISQKNGVILEKINRSRDLLST